MDKVNQGCSDLSVIEALVWIKVGNLLGVKLGLFVSFDILGKKLGDQ